MHICFFYDQACFCYRLMHFPHLYREMVRWNVVKQKYFMCEPFLNIIGVYQL